MQSAKSIEMNMADIIYFLMKLKYNQFTSFQTDYYFENLTVFSSVPGT